MSQLTDFRAHCLKMATAPHRADCPAAANPRRIDPRCAGGPAGCNPLAERELWAQLAGEIHRYLDNPITPPPNPEDELA